MARLDSELVARGIARSRERAKEMIKSGNVTVNGITAKSRLTRFRLPTISSPLNRRSMLVGEL